MKLISQKSQVEGAFGYNISCFKADHPVGIASVIRAKILDLEIKPEHIRQSIHENKTKFGYLKGLFVSENLSESDFKHLPSCCIRLYLEGFSDSEEEWGEDKPIFKNLIKRFFESEESNLNDCYLLNMDWFSKVSAKVREREFTLYDIYLLMVWKEKDDDTIAYVAEWSSD